MVKQIFHILILVLLIIIVSFLVLYLVTPAQAPQKTTFGITFSKMQAESLGLDWPEAYLAVLDDLKVKHLRLPVYWNEIEPEKNQYFFTDLDWQISQAKKRDVEIILVIGRKQPRWPECFIPDWAKAKDMQEQHRDILEMLKTVVQRYQDEENIWAWQIENEPLFRGGDCPECNKKFLDQEIALVRYLDPRPIIITDSGEFSFWIEGPQRANVFGTSLYKIVRNKVLGYISYEFIPVSFYQKKATLIKKIFPHLEEIIIIELQAEPWVEKLPITRYHLAKQFQTMDFNRFRNTIEYAKAVGYPKTYLWGVEWWYYLKVNENHPEFWQEAKHLFMES